MRRADCPMRCRRRDHAPRATPGKRDDLPMTRRYLPLPLCRRRCAFDFAQRMLLRILPRRHTAKMLCAIRRFSFASRSQSRRAMPCRRAADRFVMRPRADAARFAAECHTSAR